MRGSRVAAAGGRAAASGEPHPGSSPRRRRSSQDCPADPQTAGTQRLAKHKFDCLDLL